MSRVIKILALAVTLATFVFAAPSQTVTAQQNPCKADLERLCGDVQPGQGRIQACLKEHKDELSAECKAFIEVKAEEVRERLEHLAEVCKGDAERLCTNVEEGEGRIFRCLFLHKDSLSPECKKAISQ